MKLLNKLVVWTIPFVPKYFVRRASDRYIAGSELDDAVNVVRRLNKEGCSATLDVLGEHITNRDEAQAAVDEYIRALERLNQERLDSNISVKLTMLGLQLDYAFCLENMRKLVQKAKDLHNFVRIDMEDSSCTTDTLKIYEDLRSDFDNVGFVVQSYMRRSLDDIRAQMNGHSPINVRVCKGIYIEPREIAYKDGAIVNANFVLLMEELLKHRNYVGIATHDERLVWEAFKLIDRMNLNTEDYEFQMLLGVDKLLRRLILNRGHRVRVYVPYGKKWYEYSVRRLKENPKIAGYVISNILGINS